MYKVYGDIWVLYQYAMNEAMPRYGIPFLQVL